MQCWLWEILQSFVLIQPFTWTPSILLEKGSNTFQKRIAFDAQKKRWTDYETTISLFGQLVLHPLIEFFSIFPIFFERHDTLSWSTFSSSAISFRMFQGRHLPLPSFRRCQLPITTASLPIFEAEVSSLEFFEPSIYAWYIRPYVICSLMALMTFRVASAALWTNLISWSKTTFTIWTSSKRAIRFSPKQWW